MIAPHRPLKPLLAMLSPTGTKVYMALRILASRNGQSTAHATVEELSQHTGLVGTWVTRGRHELIALGVIEQSGKSTYRFLATGRPWIAPAHPIKSDPVHENAIPSYGISKTKKAEKGMGGYRGGSGGTQGGARSRVPRQRLHVAYHRAANLLGLGTGYGDAFQRMVFTIAGKRMREGYTIEDLLAVVQWAVNRWHGGDHFPPLRDLSYLWGKRFPTHLATSKVSTGSSLNFRSGPDATRYSQRLVERFDAPARPPREGKKT